MIPGKEAMTDWTRVSLQTVPRRNARQMLRTINPVHIHTMPLATAV